MILEKEMQLVTYNSSRFLRSKFVPIDNDNDTAERWTAERWIKPPHGQGLWASPVDSEYGWKEWCAGEEFGIDLTKSFEFDYAGTYLVVDNRKDMLELPWRSYALGEGWPSSWRWIDFYHLLHEMKVDAVHLTVDGQRRTRFPHSAHSDQEEPNIAEMIADLRNLNGWDCECVLVLNPDKVRSAPKRKFSFAD